MSNKLFLVCPFSNMETFIRKRYGNNVFFMTSIAAIFQSRDKKYLEVVRNIISQNQITSIYIVNDIDCLFINNVVSRAPLFGTEAETILEDVFIENINTIIRQRNLYLQKKKLAEANLNIQANALIKSEILGELITQEKIKVICVLAEKTANKHLEIEIQSQAYL